MSSRRSISDHLPTVLLIEIFLYLLTSPGDDDPPFNNARTILCTVCKYWRDIIVGYPQFWSTFHFYPLRQQVPPSILNTWLQRSADSPISIYISSIPRSILGGWWTAEDVQYHRKLLSLLLQRITQWKKLEVESTGTFMLMIQDLEFTPAHSLEEVSFEIVHCSLDSMLRVFLALNGAPNLTSLKFTITSSETSISILLNDPGVSALFKRLGVLEVNDNIQVSEALDIIRTCQSAERIYIRPTRVQGGPMTMASSEKLSILELVIYDGEAGAMLAYLHLPNLKVLLMRCIQNGGSDLARVVSELVGDPSKHALQVLKLVNVTFDALEDLVRTHGLSKIPIVEFQPRIRESDAKATNGFDAILHEKLKRWEEIDNRFRMCLLLDNDYLVYAVGWVDSRWYEHHRQSLPCDVFDGVHVGRLLV